MHTILRNEGLTQIVCVLTHRAFRQVLTESTQLQLGLAFDQLIHSVYIPYLNVHVSHTIVAEMLKYFSSIYQYYFN